MTFSQGEHSNNILTALPEHVQTNVYQLIDKVKWLHWITIATDRMISV